MPYLAKERAASKVYAKEFKAWHKKARAETIARHKETQAKTRKFEKDMAA